MKHLLILLLLNSIALQHAGAASNMDSVLVQLQGCWRWDHYYGGIAWLPPQTPWEDVRLVFSRDAQDSLDRTVSFKTYVNNALTDSGRADVEADTNNAAWFSLTPDVFESFLGWSGMNAPVHFRLFNDSVEFTHFYISDDFYYVFGRDSCPPQSVSIIDSVIQSLNGCWRWDHYFGGFAGLPPTPAWDSVKIEFSRDAADSANQTLTGKSYLNDSMQFSGTCHLSIDSNFPGLFKLSCGLFDSIGIVASAPLYFYFENDTLLFPQQQWVDGFVYGFLKNCPPDIPTSRSESHSDFQINVYPNPASGTLNISAVNVRDMNISIYNSTGQCVEQWLHGAEEIKVIDVFGFSKGLYIIVIETNSIIITKKAIVLD